MSNLGRHELTGYRRIHAPDIWFVGPVFPANVVSVSVLTVNNAMHIVLRYNEPELNTEHVQTLYKKALALLNVAQ